MASVQGSAPKIPSAGIEAHGWIESLAHELFSDREHIGWRHHDDVGLEVADELHLLLRLASRHRDHHAAQMLGAVVNAQASSKQAISISDMNRITPGARRQLEWSARPDAPRFEYRERCIPPQSAFPSCRSKHESAQPAREERRTVRKVRPREVRLGRKRKVLQVRELLQIVGMNPRQLALATVGCDVLVGMTQ